MFERFSGSNGIALGVTISPVISSYHSFELASLWKLLISLSVPSHLMGSNNLSPAKRRFCSLLITDVWLLPNFLAIIGLFDREPILGLPLALLNLLINRVGVLLQVELIQVNGVLTQNSLLNSLVLVARLIPHGVLRLFCLSLLS